jgi:hypothetical protein
MDCISLEMIELFKYFVQERWRIHVAKDVEKLDPPWTQDPILQKYRFCNVMREHDKVTLWIAKHWRNPHRVDPMLVFNMAVARLINYPPALADIAYQMTWNDTVAQHVRYVIKQRQARGDKCFSSAYMVTGTESKGMEKIDFVLLILSRLWEIYPRLNFESCEQFSESIKVKGISTFLSGQIVADVKYTPWLKQTPDWWVWSTPGPGSIRGLNRMYSRPLEATMTIDDFNFKMRQVMAIPLGIVLHAQDLQNCLCEFDKYCRVKFGQGQPKQLYQPTGPEVYP